MKAVCVRCGTPTVYARMLPVGRVGEGDDFNAPGTEVTSRLPCCTNCWWGAPAGFDERAAYFGTAKVGAAT